MHMKHSHLLKIRSAAATLCAAALLCACTNELRNVYEEEDGEFTTVTLQVGSASSQTKGLTPDQEGAINSLYILAFQPDADDGGTYKLTYKATGKAEPGVAGKFSFSLRTSLSGQPDTKLLLVANENPNVRAKEDMTLDGVQAALISGELSGAPVFAGIGIPMFGFAGDDPDTPLTITKGQSLTANLLRAVARVDVGVGTYNEATGEWTKGSVNFDLTHVYVFKPQNKYTLIPLLGNLEYTNGIPSVTAPSTAGTWGTNNFSYTGGAITNNTSCKAEIYIPEVNFAGGTVYDENHAERTALVIGGIYDNKTCYYRIDFTNAPTNTAGTPLENILRNHIYRFSITNVSLPGYDSPEKAYSGKPVGLSFTARITDWKTGGRPNSPSPELWVRMNYDGINGTITKGLMKPDGATVATEVTVTPKKNGFETDNGEGKATLNYNNLLGEAIDNTYNGMGNGGIYRSVTDALRREGPYPRLIIAPDNASESIRWRSTPSGTSQSKRVLDAKKICREYRAQGSSDWRLPRLSEVCLIWLNKETINQSKGFTSLGGNNVTYWTGSEGTGDQAYSVNAAGEIKLQDKTTKLSVRCVREVR